MKKSKITINLRSVKIIRKVNALCSNFYLNSTVILHFYKQLYETLLVLILSIYGKHF